MEALHRKKLPGTFLASSANLFDKTLQIKNMNFYIKQTFTNLTKYMKISSVKVYLRNL